MKTARRRMADILIDVQPIGQALGRFTGRLVTNIAYRLGGWTNDSYKSTSGKRRHIGAQKNGNQGDCPGPVNPKWGHDNPPVPRVVVGAKGELVWRYGSEEPESR